MADRPGRKTLRFSTQPSGLPPRLYNETAAVARKAFENDAKEGGGLNPQRLPSPEDKVRRDGFEKAQP